MTMMFDRTTRPSGARPHRPARRRAGRRRAADFVLIALAVVIVAIFLISRFFGGGGARDAKAARPSTAASITATGTAPSSDQFADLEASPSDGEESSPEESLPGPVMFSDQAVRPFPPVNDQRLAALLDPEISKAMTFGRIPSLAVALVSGERIVWTRAAGLANIRVKTPAACDTVYLIGSTFKTMSTMALLQQLDQGKFKLDDRVNDYLTDFKIEPNNTRFPVTFRNLLTHTSGLPTDFGRHAVWDETGPPQLADYLKGALRLERRPLTRVVYSNIAYALVAYLVEKFSGVPFKDYMRRNIFGPIELHDTAFEPRPDMAERLAIPYIPIPRRGAYRPVDWVKADVWPAGVVYGTAVDQARWLMANLNGATVKGRRLLSESTFREMTRRQYDRFAGPLNGGWLNETTGYGLTWWVSHKDGETIIAHSGSVSGYTAFLAGSLDRKIGIAVVTNGNKAHRFLYALALKALDALRTPAPPSPQAPPPHR